jgi:uncharacterized protein
LEVVVRSIRLALALLIANVVALPAVAQTTPAPPETSVIVTSGEGEVKRAPDRAWVVIRAESRARDPKEAQRLNTEAMVAVTAKLKGMALGDDVIRTISYELQPEFDYANGRQTLRGYLARNAIEVRVDDVTRVGDVLGAAVGSGATSVGGLRFDLKDMEAAEREALRLAVRDARGRADAAATGAGVRIDRVIRIEEIRSPIVRPQPMQQMREMASVAMAADAPPPIAPGTIEIRAQVTLTAAIR